MENTLNNREQNIRNVLSHNPYSEVMEVVDFINNNLLSKVNQPEYTISVNTCSVGVMSGQTTRHPNSVLQYSK